MKIVHWTALNGSGMANMAIDISNAERELGLASIVLRTEKPDEWAAAEGADIHVVHTHLPIRIDRKKAKLVWVAHGTPEHCFQTSVEKGISQGNYAPDSFMMSMHMLKSSDAIVTFWERQAAIWKSLSDERTKDHIYCIPMGINLKFWHKIDGIQKYAGHPSIMSAENCHWIKWPLDMVIALPWIAEEIPSVRMHIFYLPFDQHRWWYPLLYRNGSAYISYSSAFLLSPDNLRSVFSGCDYYLNPVRYGDHNRVGIEAKACGCKVISYAGNPYADFWITEGDQRTIAKEMISIFKGEIESRQTDEVKDITETAKAMISIYEGL